jgi:hypothetical protein
MDAMPRYNPSELEDYLVDLSLVKGEASPADLPADLPEVALEELPVFGKARDYLLNGVPAGARSEAIFAVECGLYEQGVADAEIAAAILRSSLGDKPREHRDPLDWLANDIGRARAHVDQKRATQAAILQAPVAAAPAQDPQLADLDCEQRAAHFEALCTAALGRIAELERENAEQQARIVSQQTMIRDLRAELTEAKEIARVESDVFANPDLDGNDKVAAVVFSRELASHQNKKVLDGGAVRVYLGTIADRMGASPDTAGKRLQKFVACDAIERTKTRTYDPQTDSYKTEMFFRSVGATTSEILRPFATLKPEPKGKGWGGARYCSDCGGDTFEIRRTVTCKSCGSVAEDKAKEVTVPTEPAAQDPQVADLETEAAPTPMATVEGTTEPQLADLAAEVAPVPPNGNGDGHRALSAAEIAEHRALHSGETYADWSPERRAASFGHASPLQPPLPGAGP